MNTEAEFHEIIRAFCRLCKRETTHSVLKEQTRKINDVEYSESKTWQIIQCGCNDISFRILMINSEDRDVETGRPLDIVEQFPLGGEKNISPKSFYLAPPQIRKIYIETIDAYNNNLLILSSAGCRAIVEGICTHEKIVSGKLESKIEELHTKGILTKKNANALQNHRFIGNKALHYLKHLTVDELRTAIEIIEHTLENIYELERKGDSLKGTPPFPNFLP